MQRYVYKSRNDAVRTKDWAAGSRIPVESTEFIISDSTPRIARVVLAPALYKIFDEILVNATDQATRMVGTKQPVKNIWVVVDQTGRIVIKNDGAGFDVCQVNVPELGGVRWLPSVLMGEFDQGTNHDSAADAESIGGTNGLGATITIAMSTRLTLRTRDENKGLYFEQTWRNGGKIVEAPIIRQEMGRGYTEVDFIPDYENVFTGSSPFNALPLFHGRTALSALCSSPTLWFNGVQQATEPSDILRMMSPGKVIDTKIGFENKQWRLYVQAPTGDPSNEKMPRISIVNGMVVKRGPHMNAVEGKIADVILTEVNKQLRGKAVVKRDVVMRCLGYILICTIDSPKPSWEGQRKDALAGTEVRYAKITIPQKASKLIADMASEAVIGIALKRKRTKTSKIDKYYPATGKNSTLICAEGDSAMSQIKTAVTNHSHMTFMRFGLFSLGGVIVNVRQNMTIRKLPNGKRQVDMSEKLKKNERINEFMKATNLQYELTYETEAERKTLKYKAIWMLPDQDYDGKGKILPLVLSFIEYCWPALLRRENMYVYWVYSPIIRLYPKARGVILEYYSIHEFEGSGVDLSKYEPPKYYKGLATHNADEIMAIFKKPRLYGLYTEPSSHDIFEVYFGEDPDKRKFVLKLPTKIPELIPRDGNISCSDQLQCEADRYQKDDLARKLDCYLDGLTLSGRKILDGCIAKFANNRKELKVDTIAGYILEKKQYEHGINSLADSIKGKAAIYVGGKQLPILCPSGMFGSRLGGISDAGASRYISASLNHNLCDVLYPAEDYELLPFTINEGMRGEPQYFLPIIPTAITEHAHLPSHGWKLQKWAVDALAVIDVVSSLVKGSRIVPRLPYYRGEWTGEFRSVGGITFTVGRYQIQGQTIIITELPLCTWTNAWVKSLEKMVAADEDKGRQSLIVDIDDTGNNEHIINTKIRLADGALQKILDMGTEFFDGVEVYFGLYTKMGRHLNLMTEKITVREFKSYEEICLAWFPHRQRLYRDRIERRMLRLRCEIELTAYQVKYIETIRDMNLKTHDDATKVVVQNGFPRLAKGMLTGKQYMTNSDFDRQFHDGDYSYLFGLTDADKFDGAYQKRKAKIPELQAELDMLQNRTAKEPFPGYTEWLAELDKLASVIVRGRATKWQFDRANKYTFSVDQ